MNDDGREDNPLGLKIVFIDVHEGIEIVRWD